jgi:hypothetical protein
MAVQSILSEIPRGRKCSWWMVLTLVVLVSLATGCLPMMVGSLGYEGYEYEKTGSLPGFPKMPSSSTHSPQAASTPSDSNSE